MRVLAFIWITVATLFGFEMQTASIHMKILPKIAMLDKDIESKLEGGRVVIAVTCDAPFCEEAREAASLMQGLFSQGINGKSIYATAVETSSFAKTQASFVYILNKDETNVKKIIQAAKNKKIATFAYYKEDLAHGAILGMSIERNGVIILNRSAMREFGIRFVDSFYKMVRMVD